MTGYERALKALKNNDNDNKHNRVLAILFLHFKKNFSAEEIKFHGCSLTIGGIKGFFKRFYHWLNEAIERFTDKVISSFEATILHHDDFLKRNSSYFEGYCAYVVECFYDNHKRFLKIGMTKDFNRRMRQHLKNPNYCINGICVCYVLPCDSEMDALIKESRFREFYEKFFKLTPKDRFYNGFFMQTDIDALTSY
jgi:predicted GIY-YIG superfamily endonuclease